MPICQPGARTEQNVCELAVVCCAAGSWCSLEAWLKGGCECVLKHWCGSSYGWCVPVLPQVLREAVSRPLKQLECHWSGMLYFWTLPNYSFSATEVAGTSTDTNWACFTVFAFHRCSKIQLWLLICIRNYTKYGFLLLFILKNLSTLVWIFFHQITVEYIHFLFLC